MLAQELVQNLDQEFVQDTVVVILKGVVAKAPWRKVRQNGELMTVCQLLCNPGELVDVEDSELLQDDTIPLYAFGSTGKAAMHLKANDTVTIMGVAKHQPEYKGPAIEFYWFDSPENNKRLADIYDYYYNKSLDEEMNYDEYDPEYHDCDYEYC